MELCVMIEGQEDVTWPQWKALAEGCERHGIPSLFRSDHYLSVSENRSRGSLDAWGTICGLAAVTSELKLGTLVSPASFRHPAVLAKLVATADHLSGGRVEPGIGAGWFQVEHDAFGLPFHSTRERVDVLAEQLEILRGLWSDGEFSFGGEHYELAPIDALPKPVQRPMPLIMGGNAAPRGAALAARYADEYNTPFPTLEEVRERRAAIEAAYEEAGRDPATVRFSIMTAAAIGDDEAEAERRRREVLARGGGDDSLVGTWVAGGPERAVGRLRELADAGVDRVMLQLLLHEDLDQLRLIGEVLAPEVADA